MEGKAAYVSLTRTDTFFSRAIRAMTGDRYTHAAIGLDGPDGPFYGFGRKYPSLPLPGAFRVECPERFRHAELVATYRLPVDDAAYARIRAILDAMIADPSAYHYNVAGVIACKLDLDVPRIRNRHFFCSQFVAWILQESGAAALPVPPGRFRPSGFCFLPGIELVREEWTGARQAPKGTRRWRVSHT